MGGAITMKLLYFFVFILLHTCVLCAEGQKLVENGKEYMINENGKYLVDTTCSATAYILIEPSKLYTDKQTQDNLCEIEQNKLRPKTDTEILQEDNALLKAQLSAMDARLKALEKPVEETKSETPVEETPEQK